jgi:hypothetical protein
MDRGLDRGMDRMLNKGMDRELNGKEGSVDVLIQRWIE